MTQRSVLVIGAGIGGITAAIHLAKAGLHVTVLEKNEQPGGRCGRFVRDGHRFDTGPTLFVMRLLYEAEFRALGASLRDRLELRPVDPTYRLVFDDASQLVLTSDMASMEEQLEALERGSFRGLQRYVEEGGRHYQVVLDKLVNRDFRRASDFFNIQALNLLVRLKPLVNHYRNMARYFDGSSSGAPPSAPGSRRTSNRREARSGDRTAPQPGLLDSPEDRGAADVTVGRMLGR